MAHRYGDVEFTVAGRTYTVRFGNLAWFRVMQRLGVPSELGCLYKARHDQEAFQVLLQEGLATYHPELQPEEVKQLFDEIARPGETSLNAALWEAVKLSLPVLQEQAKGGGPNAQPAARTPSPTRTRSGKRR